MTWQQHALAWWAVGVGVLAPLAMVQEYREMHGQYDGHDGAIRIAVVTLIVLLWPVFLSAIVVLLVLAAFAMALGGC